MLVKISIFASFFLIVLESFAHEKMNVHLSLYANSQKIENGSAIRFVDFDKEFYVVITNLGNLPIKIWDPKCSWSEGNVFFEVEKNGVKSFLKKKPAFYSRNVPRTIKINAGESYLYKIHFTKEEWDNVELLQKQISIRCHYDTEKTAESVEHKVYTKKLSSQAIKWSK